MEELQAKYGVKQGPLHQLQERAGPFAAMVAAFCHRLGWVDLEELIAKLQVPHCDPAAASQPTGCDGWLCLLGSAAGRPPCDRVLSYPFICPILPAQGLLLLA